jgi:hypothetical protein
MWGTLNCTSGSTFGHEKSGFSHKNEQDLGSCCETPNAAVADDATCQVIPRQRTEK